MDPPPPSRKEHRQRGHDLRQVQGMNSHENKSEQGVAPYVTQGVPRVNADVGPKTINDGITENYRRQRRHPIIRTKYAQRTATGLRDG